MMLKEQNKEREENNQENLVRVELPGSMPNFLKDARGKIMKFLAKIPLGDKAREEILKIIEKERKEKFED